MKSQRDVATTEISRTEGGVQRTSWDIRPRRERSSSKVPRRCSERARDGLHNKFIERVFLWRMVVSERKQTLPALFAGSVGSGAVVRRRTCQADGGSLFRRVSPGSVVCKRRKVVFFWFGTRSISVFRLLELRLLGRESTANNRIHSPPFPFFRSHFPGTFTSGV